MKMYILLLSLSMMLTVAVWLSLPNSTPSWVVLRDTSNCLTVSLMTSSSIMVTVKFIEETSSNDGAKVNC